MADYKIIDSPLSRIVEEDGISVDVRICRLEDTEWSLEIVASDGNSTVWNDVFPSDEDALAAFADELLDPPAERTRCGASRATPRPARRGRTGSI